MSKAATKANSKKAMADGIRAVQRLEDRIGYSFKDKSLAAQAMTHSSYGDGRRKQANNEQLEFLGDRVLGLITSDRLYALSLDNEGSMARRLNALVRKEACARVGRAFGLGECLLLSPSEVRQGGRDKTSILGDACEALLGALYLDGGLEAAAKFYDTYWGEAIAKASRSGAKDPKTALQEKASAAGFGLPEYNVLEQSGPDHRPLFVIEVTVEGLGGAQGTGKSKKDAERFAAVHLLESWEKGMKADINE